MTWPPRARCCAIVLVLLAGWVHAWPAAAEGFVINEVLRRNDRLFGAEYLDEDGSRQPWIEIRNDSAVTASLLGWSLSWSPTDPDRFELPDVTVSPGESVVVWLSGKDRAVAGSPLHADFTPDRGIDFYLFDTSSALADAFVGRRIPVDHSLGRCQETADGSFHYYDDPTPGLDNAFFYTVPFVFLDERVSLTAGQSLQLRVWPDVEVDWSSNNPNVTVSSSGVITATSDFLAPDGQAEITATLAGGSYSQSLDVTVVGWASNVSWIDLAPQSLAQNILAGDGSRILFSVGTVLYESTAGLEDAVVVGSTPVPPNDLSRITQTPFGNFLIVGADIYRATDLTNWSLAFQMDKQALRHMFDTYWDASTQTGYVFAGEYSALVPTNRHKVYRGTYPNGGAATWETLLDFDSLDAWLNDPGVLGAVRHVHVVIVDPENGDLYVGTGDDDLHSRILHSTDFGDTFSLIGLGRQDWRTLAIWFTPDYVYWGMDTSAPQSVWRIARAQMNPDGSWPSITPELSTGETQTGVEYYVTQESNASRFPVGVGETFVEDASTTPLDADHRVRPLDDVAYDYREEVALVDNGDHWYQGDVTSEQGDAVSLFSMDTTTALIRDYEARLIGIKEGVGGAPLVQEIAIVRSEFGLSAGAQTRLIPKAQGPDGMIYFAAQDAAHGRYRGRLHWYDDAASAPPEPTPPAPPAPCLPVPEPGWLAMWGAGLPLLGALARGRRERSRADAAIDARQPALPFCSSTQS